MKGKEPGSRRSGQQDKKKPAEARAGCRFLTQCHQVKDDIGL
jgi:hypothetical protein